MFRCDLACEAPLLVDMLKSFTVLGSIRRTFARAQQSMSRAIAVGRHYFRVISLHVRLQSSEVCTIFSHLLVTAHMIEARRQCYICKIHI